MDFLPGVWNLSPLAALIGVVILMFWLVTSGRFIPRASHEREIALEQKRADEWKETAIATSAVNVEVRRQNGQLIEANRVVEAFLRVVSPRESLADTVTRPPGGSDVAV